MLVRDVEVPLEGTAGQEACPLLNAQDFSRGSGARQLGASCAGRRRGPFPWVRCGRLLEELHRRLVSRVKVRDQGGTLAIRARQPTGQPSTQSSSSSRRDAKASSTRSRSGHSTGQKQASALPASEAGGDWIPGGSPTSGVAGTRTSGCGDGGGWSRSTVRARANSCGTRLRRKTTPSHGCLGGNPFQLLLRRWALHHPGRKW